MLLIDEFMFGLNSHVKTQKTRIWGTLRPPEHIQEHVHSPGVTVQGYIDLYWVESGMVATDSYKFMLFRKYFSLLGFSNGNTFSSRMEL